MLMVCGWVMVTLTDFDYLFSDKEFAFTGFNGKILNNGDCWQFWECPCCGNATAGRPDRCEKCNGGSFEWINIRGRIRSLT